MVVTHSETPMKHRLGRRLFLACLVALSPAMAAATIRLDLPFGNNMVLQRHMPAPVWGTADPGEAVTVSFLDQQQSTVADDFGHWKVVLDPLEAGGPFTLTVSGSNTVVFTGVMVGEVWVCSGQSNL